MYAPLINITEDIQMCNCDNYALNTEVTKMYDGHKLYQLKALVDINEHVLAGSVGGFVESLDCLVGNSWVCPESYCFEEVRLIDSTLKASYVHAGLVVNSELISTDMTGGLVRDSRIQSTTIEYGEVVDSDLSKFSVKYGRVESTVGHRCAVGHGSTLSPKK
jgi:hypothetical protein